MSTPSPGWCTPLTASQAGTLFHARYDDGSPDVYVGRLTRDWTSPPRTFSSRTEPTGKGRHYAQPIR